MPIEGIELHRQSLPHKAQTAMYLAAASTRKQQTSHTCLHRSRSSMYSPIVLEDPRQRATEAVQIYFPALLE